MKISPRYDGPPLISIDGPPDDQLAPVVRQRRRMEVMLADLSAEDWQTPSRCEGWTAQDVISHVIGVNKFWELSVREALAGTPTRFLVGFDPAATPAQMVGAMRDLTTEEVFDQFVASNDGFLGVLSGLDADAWMTVAETPPGHIPIRLLASHAVWDTWVHERDIALPLGLTPPIETDEVIAAMRYAAALSPGFLITQGRDCTGWFGVEVVDLETSFALEVGNSVAVHDGDAPAGAPILRGDAIELVEALSIRAPLPDAAPPEWRELLVGLVTAFDTPTTVG
jgi:uncharacterized protein (TIGR03083 family)